MVICMMASFRSSLLRHFITSIRIYAFFSQTNGAIVSPLKFHCGVKIQIIRVKGNEYSYGDIMRLKYAISTIFSRFRRMRGKESKST